MEEVWKDIYGYEGIYQVSNLGRIKSLRFKKEKILKLGSNPLGYAVIGLWKNKEQKFYPVHRIVAKAFILNPNNKKEINHIDGNKKNNNVYNLEWVSRSENMKHAISMGLLKIKRNNIASKEIVQLDLDNKLIKVWGSCKEITRKLGFSDSHVYSCCKNKRKTAYGYKWKYKNELDVSKTY